MKKTMLALGMAVVLSGMGVSDVLGVYTIQEINNPYGAYDIRALDLNDAGMAVGYMKNSLGYPQPFVYENGAVTELPKYGGAYKSEAYAINNAAQAQVTGYMPTRVGIYDWHKVRWDQGAGGAWPATDLGTVTGEVYAAGRDINDPGQITGGYNTQVSLYLPTAAYGLPAGMNNLGTVGGVQSQGFGINENGEIAVQSQDSAGTWRAAIWLPTAAYGLTAGMTQIDAGGTQSYSTAINDAGQMTGYRLYSGTWDTFLWDNNVRIILPKVTGATHMNARDINNAGVVVGSIDLPSGRTGFIWDSVNGTQVLSEFSEWSACEFYGISDTGYITGYGTNPSGVKVGFVVYDAVNCGDWGYMKADVNENCSVGYDDLAMFAADWLKCTNPNNENCDPAP